MTSLTDAQNRYLALAWLCIDAEPKVIISNPNPSVEHEVLVNSMGTEPIITFLIRQLTHSSQSKTCTNTSPLSSQINYERFATLAGSKTANSAREMLRVTKKKLYQEFGSLPADGTVPPPNTPATVTKTPRKKATPKTKSTAKPKGGKKRKISSDSDDESDAGDDTPIKKKTVVKEEVVDEKYDEGVGAGAEVDSEDAEV